MKMKLLCSDVPVWLKDSAFYISLDSDEANSYIDVPDDCFRATDDDVHTVHDLAAILHVMRFWGVTRIPYSVLEYCCTNKLHVWDQVFVEIFGRGMPEHTALISAFEQPQQFTLEVALTINRPEFVDFWLSINEKANTKCAVNAITHACRFGRLDLVQTLREKGFPWGTYECCAAAQYGHIDVLVYLRANFPVYTGRELAFAARGGHVECLKYLHPNADDRWSSWDQDITMEYAVPSRYELLKNRTHDYPWTDDFTIAPPVNGYFECLHYVLENGCPIHKDACRKACEYGLLDCLQLLHQYGASWNASTATAACSAGHLDCLEYLHTNGCPFNDNICDEAARNGHIDCLEYLHNIGYPWHTAIPAFAAFNGHLQCLQYLHNNDCPWSEASTYGAAYNGHLNCLQYLYENNCPWNVEASKYAAESGHLDCLQYLHDHGCPWNDEIPNLAASNGHFACLQYALENDCPYHKSLLLHTAARCSNIACLQYLLEDRKFPISSDWPVFETAFLHANLVAVEYLIMTDYPFQDYTFSANMNIHGSDGDFMQCIQYAVERGWQYNQALYDVIMNSRKGKQCLRMCRKYVNAHGWKEALLAKEAELEHL